MKTSKITGIFFLNFILMIISCNPKQGSVPDYGYVAFSLRAAQQILKNSPESGELGESGIHSLGGISRLVGMVIDREHKDIILIGKKIPGIRARFEDLVVAIRTRFRYNDLPLVSIDPTPYTLKTGLQQVRFGGHIERTRFGKDFLDCDILLKKYSLELTPQIQSIASYRRLLSQNAISQLKGRGVSTLGVNWVDQDSIKSFVGKTQESCSNYQARFWFNYKDPYKVRIRDDVFCLMSLDICVQNEVTSANQIQREQPAGISSPAPDQLFTDAFTQNFYQLSESFPVLKRMKLLFDMTAIAEGMKNTKDLPDINYLINDYKVPVVSTAQYFKLIRQCGIINRDDGRSDLIQVSGGVETSVELEWLNGGDISYLKQFVLGSRPNENSIFWQIPINDWNMPNSNGIASIKTVKSRSTSGCAIDVSSAVLNHTMTSLTQGLTRFAGFHDPEYSADPIRTNGVQMKMIVDTTAYTWVDTIKTTGIDIRNQFH